LPSLFKRCQIDRSRLSLANAGGNLLNFEHWPFYLLSGGSVVDKIQRAWETFIQNGIGSKAVRKIIAASWERSQGYHIPIERREAPLAPETEAVRLHTEHAALITAARPALEQARFLLAQASSIIILTDPSGVIIETAGDPRTTDIGRIIHLEQGGQWAETDMGTNAIGTAIAALQPTQIHGVEHFCSEVQRWTCAATPIWHPIYGEFLGVLDISGPATTFNPQSLPFAVAVGRQIEGVLAQLVNEDHERLLRYFVTKCSHWRTEDIVAVDRRGMIVCATGAALQVVERRQKGLICDGRISCLDKVPFAAWPHRLSQVVPNASTELVVDFDHEIGAILVLHKLRRKSIPAIKREEKQAVLPREQEMFAKRRTIELAKANEVLRGCLDALAAVPNLDEFLGQVVAAIARELRGTSSVLRLRDFEANCLTVDLVFQDGRVMNPAETKYPEWFRSIPLDKRQLGLLKRPAVVMHLTDKILPLPDGHRSYLLGLGVRTLLVIPLNLGTQLIGSLAFHFAENRDFKSEEIAMARALENQAVLAIQVTRLAKAARQSAVLEERNRLAGEIHDGLAQSFTAICMQLGVAQEELASNIGDPLCRIQRAVELANIGLDEARRSAHNLRLSNVYQPGLSATLQALVERSAVAGRLRCDFKCENEHEHRLPPNVQHELLRIAQEAIHNAVRHANPTSIEVSLRGDAPNLVLQVKDNGSGISSVSLGKSEGFGLSNMRARATQIGATLEIQTAVGHGTIVMVNVPTSS
jgi:signal transduction histidine kinase